MENKFYFYEKHIGGYFKSNELLDEEELYCELCDDCDMLCNEVPITIEEFAKEYPDIYAEGENND